MQFRHLLSLVLALIVAGPLPARAEAPPAKDAATIGDCLRKLDKKRPSQEAEEAACLMTVARLCMGGDETNVTSRRQIDCLDRERLVWDKIVNDSYQAMMKALDSDQQAKLREMQRSWIQTRDLTCMFWYDYFQGTMANPMIAYCNNRETARRAIFLRVFALDIADRK
jgi:uncharacterized protein YecT (DUF1311 family)